MAITKADVQKLANLSRLEVAEDEAQKLAEELGSILEYVGQINNALTNEDITVSLPSQNILRADKVTNKPEEFTSSLLKSAPSSEQGFVKVKKII